MVSIIILSYNTKDLLKSCLQSIYMSLKKLDFEIIVFDNASSDGSFTMVSQDFKKVRVIKSSKNLGFAKGINLAEKHAKGEYLLFLNSDTKVTDGSIGDMVGLLEKDNRIAVVGGKLQNEDKTTSESYGNFYHLLDVFRLLFFQTRLKREEFRHGKAVDWVSGGFMLTRRSTFEELAGFDEHFFMYMEDMEFCFRVKKRNLSVWYLPSAGVMHIGQGSSNRSFAIVQIYKGLLYFYKKHKSSFEYFMVKLMLVMKGYLSILIGTLTNNSYLRSTYAQALKF